MAMYLTSKTYVKSDMKISDIVRENPSILLVLEHFGIEDVLQDKTISGYAASMELKNFCLLLYAICIMGLMLEIHRN